MIDTQRHRVLLGLLVFVGACTPRLQSQQNCEADDSCAEPAVESDYIACTADDQCPSGMCGRDGLCVGTQTCFVTAECPIDLYCNLVLATPVCAPLPPGSCREDSHCHGGVCSAAAGGLGSCAECLSHSDCASGVCNMDGSCAPMGSAPATCPEHASVSGGICVCDAGYQLDPASSLCVDDGATPRDPLDPSADACELAGRYGDGSCDPDCPQPDPDCSSPADYCEAAGYYGDGECDAACPQPDPDCSEPDDYCAAQDYYGDGICDDFCPQPDPDCEIPQTGDPCGDETYYGRCVGNTLVYCLRDAVDVIDCGDYDAVCDLVDYEYGYDCLDVGY